MSEDHACESVLVSSLLFTCLLLFAPLHVVVVPLFLDVRLLSQLISALWIPRQSGCNGR